MRDGFVIDVGRPLLERGSQLEELERLLAGAKGGEGRLVLVEGEAGAGKSALVRRFCARTARRALSGFCDPLSTPRPLGPFLDVAQQAEGELAALLGRGTSPGDVVTALVAELRRVPGTVLVIEDLHWADEATLDALLLLGRRLAPLSALVVLTARDEELQPGHPVRRVLGELATAPGVLRLRLAPLSPAAVRALAGPQRTDAERLHHSTGGNPFFVIEALAAPEGELPPTVMDAVLARVHRLRPAARSLLEATAVVAVRADLWLLERIGEDGSGALDECVTAGLLERRGDEVGFRHELARLAVEESIPPDRVAALHRRMLRALQESNVAVDLARLAHHASGAGDADLVLGFAPAAAAHAASLGAHREAAAHYRRALAVANGLAPARRATLLEALAYECYLIGELGEAIAARQQALDCHRAAGNRRRQGDQLRWLSRLEWLVGRWPQGQKHARASVALLERVRPGRELAMAYSNLCQLHMLDWNLAAARHWGERAVSLAGTVRAPEVLVHALTNVGAAELRAGRPAGLAQLERSLELSLRLGLHEHAARAFFNLASTAAETRSHARAEHYLARGLEYCEQRELVAPAAYLLAWKARSALDQGRWDVAGVRATSVLAIVRAEPAARTVALTVLGLVRARRGEPGAWQALDKARELALPTGLPSLARVSVARAEAAWLDDDSAAIAGETEAAWMFASLRSNAWVAGELALWRGRAGLTPVSTDDPEPLALELAGKFEDAARAWEDLGCPYEAALALAGADDEAALRVSLERLHTLEARPPTRLVSRRLRERGARGVRRGPRPRTRANPVQLTARQLEVLSLLAVGLTNREIADRLVISTKTAEHHVSAVLGKLGARTRSEAGVRALRLGICPQDGELARAT